MRGRLRFCLLAAVTLVTACGQEAPPAAEGALGIPSGTYAVDRSHTYVTFSYLHQGLSYPLLRVTDIDGELELDSGALENSTVGIAVAVDSIRSNLDYFDKELASRKFFHADKYPYITFATASYTPVDDRNGELAGYITIRGITRPITLSVTINGAMEHPMMDVPVIGVSATGTLSRSAFELDRFVPMVADEVTISIEAEFLHGSNEGSAAAAGRSAAAIADVDSLQSSLAGAAQ